MHVVGHQTPGNEVEVCPICLLAEEVKVHETICVSEEDAHPAHAALGDMVREARDDDPPNARHARS